MKFFVTGGAGFIGSTMIRFLINSTQHSVLNVDKLTYAGNLDSLNEISHSRRYQFFQGDICNHALISKLFLESQPDVVMHFAAESHVDRSIDSAADFIKTNILGTWTLLDIACEYWSQLSAQKKQTFRFHHISTDEVYGSLSDGSFFKEDTPYDPSSPYSASKASSDHLVRAWHRTYGFPILITNCSNNYGPYQFPEKLIPQMILKALEGKPLSVYGDGEQIRDWLYVEDHVRALYQVIIGGIVGDTYSIGGRNERTNISVVHAICDLLDELRPPKFDDFKSHRSLISFVEDRPGHDRRYAIDAGKIQRELGWIPKETFDTALHKTVSWYINHTEWWQPILDGSYKGQRLGLNK